jgi:hypothetical protein
MGTWGNCIHRLGNDFTDVAVIGSALRQSLSENACPVASGSLASRRTVERSNRP